MEDIMSQLSLIQILEAERLELGESQKVFAKRFFVDYLDPQSYYASIKCGRMKFQEKCLGHIAQFLGIPFEDVQQMNTELKPAKPRKAQMRYMTPLSPSAKKYMRRQKQLEEGWQIEPRSSRPDHICAYLWDDTSCRNLNGDKFLECHYTSVGPEKLYAIMQAVIKAGIFGYDTDCKFLIVDSRGVVQYDGSREEPWAPWISERWACQI